MLTESSTTKQIEIAFEDGAPAHVFRETKNAVLKDGVEIASNFHRESYLLDSDEARAVLGDALAGAMAQVQALTAQVEALTAERDGALDQIAHLEGKLATANARVAELEAAAAPEAAPDALPQG